MDMECRHINDAQSEAILSQKIVIFLQSTPHPEGSTRCTDTAAFYPKP
jgi:hypothetical protein